MLTQSVNKCEGCNTSFMHSKTLQRHQDNTCTKSQPITPTPSQDHPSPRPKQKIAITGISDTDKRKRPPVKAKKVKKIVHRRRSSKADEPQSNGPAPHGTPKEKGQVDQNSAPSSTSSKEKNKAKGKSVSKSAKTSQASGRRKHTESHQRNALPKEGAFAETENGRKE